MKKTGGQIVLSILKIILSVILSAIFLVTAFASPLYYAAAGIVRPNNIAKAVQNIDYMEILRESEEFNKAVTEFGIESDKVDEIMKTAEIGGFIKSCADIIGEALISQNAEGFSAAELKDIVNEHSNEIAAALQEKLNEPMTPEEIKDIMHNFIDENTEAIESTVKELASDSAAATAYRTVQKTLKWYVVLIVALVNAVILGIIYLLHIKKTAGFIWIAVDTGIVALMLGAVSVILNSKLLSGILADLPSFVSGMAVSVLGGITLKLIIAVVVLALIMVAAITAFILLRKFANKKAVTLTEAPEMTYIELTEEQIQVE